MRKELERERMVEKLEWSLRVVLGYYLATIYLIKNVPNVRGEGARRGG